MRWLTKSEVQPQGGEVRYKKVFAWKKTKVGLYTVWLEYFEVKERFFEPISGNPGWWSEESRTASFY